MNLDELRIGNWVRHQDNYWSYRNDGLDTLDFQWTSRDWCAIGEYTLSEEYIDPIPLTEEWMAKLGATEDEHGYLYIKVPIGHDSRIYLTGGFVQLTIGHHAPMWNYEYATSVHQLQNIYYALTGEELT